MIQIFYNNKAVTKEQAFEQAKAILKRVKLTTLKADNVTYHLLNDENLKRVTGLDTSKFPGKDVIVLAFTSLYV